MNTIASTVLSLALFAMNGNSPANARLGSNHSSRPPSAPAPANAGAPLAARTKDASFYFVQVVDPQLGVKNAYGSSVEEAMDWSAEKDLFRSALESIVRLDVPPKFVAIGGDMQQFYPKNEGGVNGVLSDHPEAGPMQAKDVRDAMVDTLGEAGIPWRVLPGNHDLDDAPDTASIDYYNNQWGGGDQNQRQESSFIGAEEDTIRGSGVPGQYYRFIVDGVVFVVLNSQLYYDDSDLPPSDSNSNYTTEQTEWFESVLDEINHDDDVKSVVVLTHIPPFAGDPSEPHGWGNWPVDRRDEIMSIATANKLSSSAYPALWLCGHFHGNARYVGPSSNSNSNDKTIEIVVTNSVTYPMEWGGVPATGSYTVEEWIEVASMPDAGIAFDKHIAPDYSRISGGPSKSGLRVVEFFNDGDSYSYRHKYFTVDEIAAVNAIDDESMAGASYGGGGQSNKSVIKTM